MVNELISLSSVFSMKVINFGPLEYYLQRLSKSRKSKGHEINVICVYDIDIGNDLMRLR